MQDERESFKVYPKNVKNVFKKYEHPRLLLYLYFTALSEFKNRGGCFTVTEILEVLKERQGFKSLSDRSNYYKKYKQVTTLIRSCDFLFLETKKGYFRTRKRTRHGPIYIDDRILHLRNWEVFTDFLIGCLCVNFKTIDIKNLCIFSGYSHSRVIKAVLRNHNSSFVKKVYNLILIEHSMNKEVLEKQKDFLKSIEGIESLIEQDRYGEFGLYQYGANSFYHERSLFPHVLTRLETDVQPYSRMVCPLHEIENIKKSVKILRGFEIYDVTFRGGILYNYLRPVNWSNNNKINKKNFS